MVLVLEDLHWADDSTPGAIRVILHDLGHVPLLLVATLRLTPRTADLDVLLDDSAAFGTRLETDRTAMISCWRGERRDADQASRRRLGISREAAFIQSMPNGDFVVVYCESDDLDAAFKGMATSDDPLDRWFRDHVRDVHGLNVEDGFPPPEQIMDFRA